MSHLPRAGDTADQRSTGIGPQLAVPAPFSMDGLRASMERYLGRPVRLVPVSMGPDAPSGVFIQTAAADYCYYEQQTSPFHQMHIALSLAARALASSPGRRSVDPRLIPAMEPQFAAPVLGEGSPLQLAGRAADGFAVLAVARAGMSWCPVPVAWRLLRRLRPLHEALTGAIPQATCPPSAGLARSARVRLHWRVVEIRDAMLALRPWRDMREARAAAETSHAAGLIGGAEFAASVEAAVLAHAVRARQAGAAAVEETCAFGQPFGLAPDLVSEAMWLARVSRRFSRLPLGDAFEDRGTSGRSTDEGLAARHGSRGKRPLQGWRNCAMPSVGRDARGPVKRLACRLDGHQAPAEAWILRRRFVRRTGSEW